jgi:hypothetical protein
MFNASDVNDAADESEYWQIISQICNLMILCDGSDIMILFLLCLKDEWLSLVLSIKLRTKISEEKKKKRC